VVAAALGLCLPAFAEPTLFAARPSTFVGAEPSAGNNADASPPAPRSADDGSRAARLRRDIIISLGAGPYEELIFRLFLVEFLLWFMTGLLKVDRQAAVVTAVLLSATLFAGYHYLPGTGERFNWGSFLFRTGAGIYFSIIFVVRGYGLAAGCHTFYDVLVDLARG
jgi:membrane protease YdiL (CAAX protease family)